MSGVEQCVVVAETSGWIPAGQICEWFPPSPITHVCSPIVSATIGPQPLPLFPLATRATLLPNLFPSSPLPLSTRATLPTATPPPRTHHAPLVSSSSSPCCLDSGRQVGQHERLASNSLALEHYLPLLLRPGQHRASLDLRPLDATEQNVHAARQPQPARFRNLPRLSTVRVRRDGRDCVWVRLQPHDPGG